MTVRYDFPSLAPDHDAAHPTAPVRAHNDKAAIA